MFYILPVINFIHCISFTVFHYVIEFLKITEMSNYRSGHPKVAASINPQQNYFSDKRETGVSAKIPAQF